MKKLGKILGMTLTVALFASLGFASDTATGTISANVIEPIAIVAGDAMSFGSFAARTGGTVSMSTAGARSSSGDVNESQLDAGQAATFTVTGEATASYQITLPANGTIVLTRGGGTETMAVDNFVSTHDGTNVTSVAGDLVSVGATLTVGNAQVAGSYSGTYPVFVEYD